MSIAAEAGTTVVKVDRNFDVAEATTVRDALSLFAPVQRVTIDFRGAASIQDAALPIVAEILKTHAQACVILLGLSRHHQCLLRYMGVRWAERAVAAPSFGGAGTLG